jgi:hypothetical protein
MNSNVQERSVRKSRRPGKGHATQDNDAARKAYGDRAEAFVAALQAELAEVPRDARRSWPRSSGRWQGCAPDKAELSLLNGKALLCARHAPQPYAFLRGNLFHRQPGICPRCGVERCGGRHRRACRACCSHDSSGDFHRGSSGLGLTLASQTMPATRRYWPRATPRAISCLSWYVRKSIGKWALAAMAKPDSPSSCSPC